MRNSAALARGTDAGQTTELDTDAESGERRQWLTEAEVEAIIRGAAGTRDQLMILIAYRHGLRVSELINQTWAQIDLDAGASPCAGSRTARTASTRDRGGRSAACVLCPGRTPVPATCSSPNAMLR